MKKITESTLPYFVVFLASIFRPTDPDLGWHLKYGEYFFNNWKILRENTFSTMMSNFEWDNISWGIDLLNYAVFHSLGFLGLSLLGAITVTLTFYFFSKIFNLNYFEKALIFPLLLIVQASVNQVSFKGQLLSILFLGILFYLLRHYENKKSKILFYVPLLFLFWANLHGQFILGLILFFIWETLFLLQEFLKKRTINFGEIKILALISLASVAATIIHPYGFKIYEDAFLHAISPDLKKVVEYVPFEEISPEWKALIVVGTLSFFGGVILFFKNKFRDSIPSIGIFSILYFLSWSVKRYAWAMYYFSIPFLKELAVVFHPGSKKAAFYLSTVLFAIYLVILLIIKMPFSQYKNMSWGVYCEVNGCSSGAVEYIRDNNLNTNLFSMYNWGGFMIWNYPEVKPSIDGRMHLWRDENGYSAFEDFYGYEQNFKDIDNSNYETVLIAPTKPVYRRLMELSREGKWSLVYKDNNASVFVRNKPAILP